MRQNDLMRVLFPPHLAMVLGLGALLAPPAAAQEGAPDAVPAAPLIHPAQEPAAEQVEASEFAKLKAAYDAAYQAWREKVQSMTEEERAQGFPETPDGAYFPKFLQLADAGNLEAKAWVLGHLYASGKSRAEQGALKARLVRELAAHPGNKNCVMAVARALTYDSDVPARDALRLVDGMLGKVTAPEQVSELLFTVSQICQRIGDEPARKRALLALQRLRDDYGQTFWGKRAAGLIFDRKHLQVGMTAPNFSGTDVHGEPIALSDYRGKVTYLVFWGFW